VERGWVLALGVGGYRGQQDLGDVHDRELAEIELVGIVVRDLVVGQEPVGAVETVGGVGAVEVAVSRETVVGQEPVEAVEPVVRRSPVVVGDSVVVVAHRRNTAICVGAPTSGSSGPTGRCSTR
jgi:hypothetical protein